MVTNEKNPLSGYMNWKGIPFDIQSREKLGGYQALRKALREHSPQEVIEIVKQSGLRGRGGGGFPTGTKWSLVKPPQEPLKDSTPRYLIANADEMEPGTFKDRILMEGDPHLLIEGMILAAYATQTNVAIIFIRSEYQLAAKRLRVAIQEASNRGYLGKNILKSGFDLDLYLHTSAGRYICGEETALLSALEGGRAIPRSKPPYPAEHGLWGRPTVVNNVETLCNIPSIISYGVKWFKSLGRAGEGGTKIFGASGRVRKPGWWELPMGTPIRELVEDHAGGMKEGYEFRALIPGGASTEFMSPSQLDTPMDCESIKKAGSRLGTGTLVVLDDKTCPVGMVHNLQRFFARESCGWCTPCREGLPWVVKLLLAIEEGQGRDEDLEILEEHTQLLSPTHTFCALAPGAMEPLKSALHLFRADFERHILARQCPWRGQAYDKITSKNCH